MAFSFGSTSNTPAPAPSFGAKAQAFGSSPDPAFGAAPAPAFRSTSAFGSTPAPAFGSTSTSTFGSTPAPAFGSTSTSTFGSASAPAFGSTPAPAFGAAPAPAFGSAPAPFGKPASTFGSTPTTAFGTPAPAFGSTFGAPFGSPPASGFGTPAVPPQQQSLPAPSIAGNMRYTDLPPHHKKAIDEIYNQMMNHRKTILQVQSSGVHAKTEKTALPRKIQDGHKRLQKIEARMEESRMKVDELMETAREQSTDALAYGEWPAEALAQRHALKVPEEKKDQSDESALWNSTLNLAMINTDRIEAVPSPCFWKRIYNMEHYLVQIEAKIKAVASPSPGLVGPSCMSISTAVQEQHTAFRGMSEAIRLLQKEVKAMQSKYDAWELDGRNVLQEARFQAVKRQQDFDRAIQLKRLQVAEPAPPAGAAPAPGGLLSSSTTSTFGSAPAPFGSTAPAPFGSSTAPTSFGSTPAPAPFGSTPALAPFGSTPAPAPFGSTSTTSASGSIAPAPAFGSTFGSTSTTVPQTPKKKSSSRSSSRSRR